MTAALRYEWRRLLTLRSTYWLIAVSVVIAATLSSLIAWGFSGVEIFREGPDFVLAAIATQGAGAGFAPLLIAYVMSIFGILTFGHEYRHGMIRATLTAVPNRLAVFAAKVVLTVVVAGLTALACAGLGLLAAKIFFTDIPMAGNDVTKILAGVSLYAALFALVGLALAAIFRNQIAAIVAVLLFPLVGEAIIRLVLIIPDAFDDIQGVAAYLPFDAGAQMFSFLDLDQVLEVFGFRPLAAVEGGITFGVFTAVLLAIAGVLFVRRDA
ncbi:MAG: hypothetical protein H0V32_07285 [Nocardioidaceae bacterium]|nr:hypothetical protein [Nocardioidaceae bacterium]MDQ3325324.1 ABC transporter permease [Actinomycetota bacterium]